MTNSYLTKIDSLRKDLEEEIFNKIKDESIRVEVEEFGKRGDTNGSIININITKVDNVNKELGNVSVYTWKDKKEINSKFDNKEIEKIFNEISKNYSELF